MFSFDRISVKPAQCKLPLEQFERDELEAAAGDRIIINLLADFCTAGCPVEEGISPMLSILAAHCAL